MAMSFYKNKQNVYYLKALFRERMLNIPVGDQPLKPPFTLHEEKDGYTCVRTTFVALMDPTGYKWAVEYLGDYMHWVKLMECEWFREAYDVWMHELKTKVQADALLKIMDIANGDGPQAVAAAKYLAGFEWEKRGRGRPSREEIRGELKKRAQELETETDDAARIGLVKING